MKLTTKIDLPARTAARLRAIAACVAIILLLPLAAPAQTAPDTAAWEQRLIEIVPNSVEGARTAQGLLGLEPDAGLEILKTALSRIPSPETRLYLINMLLDHPRVIDILDLGVNDPSLYVQNRCLQALELYSFEGFAEDFGAYESWRKRQAGRTLEATMRESCREYVQSVGRLDDSLRFQRLTLLQRIAYNLGGAAHARERRRAMLESGLPEALALWVRNPSTAWTAFSVLRNLKMDETYLRRVVVPITDAKYDVNFRRQAIGVLATPDNRWAADLLLKMFVEEYPDAEAENIGYALGQLGEPRIVPTVIAMIDADRTQEGQRVLGNLLNLMTGNASGQMHDGGWWRAWWTRNAGRFPADVRTAPLPRVVLRPRTSTPGVARLPEQHQIAGDFKRTYWLVPPVGTVGGHVADASLLPPAPPGAARLPGALPRGNGRPELELPGLIVVLAPDGNGSSAALFWQEVELKSLQNRYYIAVAAAPKWSDTQTATWLTADSVKQVKEAKFTTERFAAEIVQDVAASHAIQPARVYLHGAAESGPAAYACALDEATPFKGFYILASAFKSAGLPPLTRARNRRYLIQHSADDKTAPYVMAAAAQKVLAEHGATVKLDTYKGGHGYVFADPAADPIRDAIAWLEGTPK